MSLVSSINIAKQALSANQAAITVVSNNVANVDTEGYSKLRVNLSSVVNYGAINNDPISIADSLSGVQVESVQRYSNSYLQAYYWQENSEATYLDEYATVAANIEDLTNELNDTGLADSLTSFYEAVDAMNDDPSDITARQAFVSAAENVCTVFNGISSNLTSLQESLVGTTGSCNPSELSDQVDEVNDLLDQIANVNDSIIKTNLGGESSTSLLDQRDALVTELSALIPVSTSENKNGTIDISLEDISLVDSTQVKGYLSAKNSLDSDDNLVTTMSIVDSEGDETYSDVNDLIDAGTIGAIIDVCGTDSSNLTISGVLDSIDTLASEFAEVFNSIQLTSSTDGEPLCINSSSKKLTAATEAIFTDGTTDYDFETDGTDKVTAANISINSAIVSNAYLVAAARADTTSSTYDDTAIGNNSNSTLMVNARTKTVEDLDDMTVEDYLASMVSEVGGDVENIETSLTTQTNVLSSIEEQLSSETGVNLDEELTDLIKYQRAYEAAARVFSACNDLLEELMNLGK